MSEKSQAKPTGSATLQEGIQQDAGLLYQSDSRSDRSRKPPFREWSSGGYWLAVVSVVLACGLRLALDPWLGDQDPYIVFVVAIAVTGLYAGVRPAFLATALGTVIAYFGFVPPRYQFGFAGIGDAAGFGVYLLTAIAVVLLTEARRRAAAQAEQSLQAHINSEQKLCDAHTLFRNFMDHSSACAYLRDESGRCVYANEGAKREFGIDPNQSNSEGFDRAHSEFRRQDHRVLDLDQTMEFMDRTTGPRGERYWLTSKFPFVDLAGRRFVGAISVEISDRIKAEEILRKTERLSAGQQMASLLAHEINNPLAALTNIVFLLSHQSLPSPSGDFVREAKDALSRINRIASMTLGFYFDEDAPASLDVCQLIDEVVEMLAATEGFRKVQISRDFNCDAILIASPPSIRQLIISLLRNAMESGAQCVRIRVRMGRDWHRSSRGGVHITVADNGCGIAPELRERVFEPFVSTKGERGAGLGLWASHAAVLRNDGRISFRSTTAGSGRGTCMRVFLPTIPPNFDDATFQLRASSQARRSEMPA